MKPIKIALLGLGTVGGGVYKVLSSIEDWDLKVGTNVEIKKILVSDISKKRKVEVDETLLTQKFDEILEDDEIKIVVELMGGIEPAKNYILQALKKGKNVVTANKNLLAMYGKEIFDTAQECNCDVRFEGSVAGGIPIIAAIKSSLIGNRIQKVMGIINGTTNYIFTKMEDEGYSYDQALKEAQNLGFAEANPENDVEGMDAAYKIAILASIAFHSRVTVNDVHVEGITKISDADFKYANNLGYTIKLLGITREESGNIEARVHPTFIPKAHPLANIKNENNAIFVTGDIVGETMFFGKGAGELPTASSVVADIAAIASNLRTCVEFNPLCTCFYNKPMKPFEEISNYFYARLIVKDHPGVLAKIASIFAQQCVSLSEILQRKMKDESAELVIITEKVTEKAMKKSIEAIISLECVNSVSGVIRVER